MKIKYLSLILAGAMCCTPMLAGGGNKHENHFSKMDADGDGKITRAEHAAGAKQMFTECDANRDGSVTAQEMDAAMAKRGDKSQAMDKSSAEKIQMIDQNGDGKLTQSEHDAGIEQMFGKMDTDRDGSLSKEEYKAGMKMKKKET